MTREISPENKKKVVERVHSYYEKLDRHAPFEEFLEYFYWDDFQIVNLGDVTDTMEGFKEWYEDSINTMFDRKHTLGDMSIEKVSEGEYRVDMEMHFQATTWERGHAKSQKVEAEGKVIWDLVLDKTDNKLKIKKYTISTN